MLSFYGLPTENSWVNAAKLLPNREPLDRFTGRALPQQPFYSILKTRWKEPGLGAGVQRVSIAQLEDADASEIFLSAGAATEAGITEESGVESGSI